MTKQLFLDLDFTPPEVLEDEINQKNELKLVDMRSAVIGWLCRQEAAGIAPKTATRLRSFMADVAAFWNRARQFKDLPGNNRLHVPCHTMIVECRRRRQDCWPDFANSRELLPRLRELKNRRVLLESEIRADEPELRETATLFDEFSEWNYSQSANEEYHRVTREIEKLIHALYKGTRFEAIRSAHLADFLYLAVPEKTVHPNELADGWGLLWIDQQQQVRLISQAENQQCPPENRFHLVQNIASATVDDVLFRNGIEVKDGNVAFRRRPSRRRSDAKKKPRKKG